MMYKLIKFISYFHGILLYFVHTNNIICVLQDSDDSDEDEDQTVLTTKSMIVCAKTDDNDASYLDVCHILLAVLFIYFGPHTRHGACMNA